MLTAEVLEDVVPLPVAVAAVSHHVLYVKHERVRMDALRMFITVIRPSCRFDKLLFHILSFLFVRRPAASDGQAVLYAYLVDPSLFPFGLFVVHPSDIFWKTQLKIITAYIKL